MSVYDKNGAVLLASVTPEMYGAVGDGVADDTLAFQNMFSGGNRIVDLSPKTYKLTASCSVYSNTTIRGNGAVLSAVSGHPLVIGELTADFATEYNGHHGITIDGVTVVIGSSSSSDCVVMAHAKDITIRNCTFKNCREHAIELNSSYNVSIDNCTFIDCAKGLDGKECVNIDQAVQGNIPSMGQWDGTICHGVRITNCLFKNCNGIAGDHTNMYYRSTDIVISGCVALECDQGIELHSYDNVVVSDCHIQSDTYGIRIHNVTACVISNVTLYGQESACIDINTADVVISGLNMGYAGTDYAVECTDATMIGTGVIETGGSGQGFIHVNAASNIMISVFEIADALDSTKLIADGSAYRDWARQA